ncbi:MAG: 4-alpha-glucanotransferase [Solirubrobacterales bacterium]|jgi:4-alpha-glucanotransferase|nr:4-alpha-glucanotransferase [Solirubrobacterales bacterium]
MPPFPRASGVQLHLTALPDGRLGPSAHAFVDWLADAGQTYWQVLPLGPPDEHRSPYKAASAFAAWDGLLAEPDAPVTQDEVASFRERHAFWIGGWEAFGGSVEDQVRFDREWAALREHAAERGVQLVGDVPIYVSPEGADLATWPELFLEDGQAGVPPDALAADGQLWGNPLYDWPAMQRRRYRWWTERLRRTFDLFDVTRIDHFRAFVAYWAVPSDATTAIDGRWRRGPGRAVFDAAAGELGELSVVAEDLGVITEPVTRLRKGLGFPGMLVTLFGFDPDDPDGPHRPENHAEDRWVYVSTHDTDTAAGWFASASAEQRAGLAAALEARGIPLVAGQEHWALTELTFASPCPVAMLAAQDVLGLGSEARMNVPGTKGRSWRWKLEPGQLTAEHAARLRAATEAAGRLG